MTADEIIERHKAIAEGAGGDVRLSKATVELLEELHLVATGVAQFSPLVEAGWPNGVGVDVVLSCGEIRRAAAIVAP